MVNFPFKVCFKLSEDINEDVSQLLDLDLRMHMDLNKKEEDVMFHGWLQSREESSAQPFTILDLLQAAVSNRE